MQGVVSKVWKKLTPTRSGVPPARRDHAAVSVGDKMLVFGGFDGHRHYYLNDLWEYSMKQNTWKRLLAWGQHPPKRRKHTAVSAGDKMLVFGGDDGLRTLYRKDLWEYSMKRNKWKQLRPKGRGPSERAAHTAVSAGDKMLVFGGEKKEHNKKHLLMDLWEYSMKQNTWKELNPTGFRPPALRDHTAVFAGYKMLVFGGYGRGYENNLYEYSMKQNTWKKLKPMTGQHSRRYEHTAVSAGDKMFVFGGDTSGFYKYMNDLWEYSIKQNTWKQLRPKGRGPSERAAHTAVFAGGKMLVFGGYGSRGKMDDLWVLRDPCGYGNVWDEYACRSCKAGKYQPAINEDSNTACIACSIGKYSAVAGVSSCTDCPDKTPFSPAGSSSSTQCTVSVEQLTQKLSNASEFIQNIHKRQGIIIHEVAKADAKADEVRTKAHGNVNKLIRSWVDDDVRKDYEALRQRNAEKKEYDETMNCRDEEKHGMALLSTFKLGMDEEVDETTCANKNREILIGKFCNFRRRLDVVLKDRKTSGKELFPNICCKEDKYDDLVKCQDPTGKVKRHEIVPFALSQGGNFTKVNLYGELVDTLKKDGYLYNGFMDALKLVKRSEALQQIVEANFDSASLCGPRLFTLPRHPEIHLCQMFHPYGELFEDFLTSFTSLMASPVKNVAPKGGKSRKLPKRRHLLSNMQGRSEHVRGSSPAMAQMLQKKTANQVKRSELSSLRAEVKTDIKQQIAKQVNDADNTDLVALKAEMKILQSQVAKQHKDSSDLVALKAEMKSQASETVALQRQVASLKQQVATSKRKETFPQTCPRITFPTKREYNQKKKLFCTGYDKLDLVNDNSVNIAVVYAPKVASTVRPKYEVVDEWQDVCASPPLFTPNDISLQQIEGKTMFVVQLDSTSPDGYLRKELPMCGLAVDDKGQRYIPRTKVTVKVFDDRGKCCDSSKDNTVCSNNGCNTQPATTTWSRKQLEYSTKITGTTYTLEKEHESRRRRRRMLQRGSVRGC